MEEVRVSVEALGLRAKSLVGDNPALRRTRMPFIFPKHGCPRLRELRRRFDFAAVVEGQDEFVDFLRLAQWVHDHLHREGRVADIDDPIEILQVSASRKAAFYCSHFAIVYSACAAALGLPVRTLGVDSGHRKGEDSTHHGTCEAYSTKWRKWLLVDAMHGMYYRKGDLPLSVYEVDREWQRNRGRDVRTVGLDGKPLARSDKHVNRGRHESSAYHYFYTPLRVDPFPGAGSSEPDRLLYFDGEGRRESVWYQGSASSSYPHVGYQGSFLATDRVDDLYFDCNAVHIQTRPLSQGRRLAVSFDTFTPNLSHFLYRVDDGAWRRFSGRRPWREGEARYLGADRGYTSGAVMLWQNEVAWGLHAGCNSLAVTPVNRFGRRGAISHLEIEIG